MFFNLHHYLRAARLAACGASAFALVSLAGCSASTALRGTDDLQKEAAELHASIISIDTHCDTPMRMMRGSFDPGVRQDQPGDESKIDFPRMKQGGLDAAFFAAWVAQGPRTPEGNRKVRERTMAIIDSIHASVGRNQAQAALAVTASDAERIKAEGRRAIYIGIENGYAIGDSLPLVKAYYDMGVRYITLSHTANNDLCGSSSNPDTSDRPGLTEFGRTVVREMNRLGILVDISHVSDRTFYDVIAQTPVPVIASHSGVRALCNIDRNMTDDMLRALSKNGGVIQITMVGEFVKDPPPNPRRDSALAVYRAKYASTERLTPERRREMRADRLALDTQFPLILPTVSDVVDHIDHAVKIAGIDHVGIGSDFDGGGAVRGCFDVSQIQNITIELLRRGYTHEAIGKIWGGNFLRVLRACEAYARAHSGERS